MEASKKGKRIQNQSVSPQIEVISEARVTSFEVPLDTGFDGWDCEWPEYLGKGSESGKR